MDGFFFCLPFLLKRYETTEYYSVEISWVSVWFLSTLFLFSSFLLLALKNPSHYTFNAIWQIIETYFFIILYNLIPLSQSYHLILGFISSLHWVWRHKFLRYLSLILYMIKYIGLRKLFKFDSMIIELNSSCSQAILNFLFFSYC